MTKKKPVQKSARIRPEVLERERKKLSLSKEQLVALSGYKMKTLQNLEAGKPSFFNTIKAFADALKISPATLIDPSDDGHAEGRQFEMEVKTCGRIFSQDQYERLVKIAEELAVQLNRAGVHVFTQQSNFSSEGAATSQDRLVLRMEGFHEKTDATSATPGLTPTRLTVVGRSLLVCPQNPLEPWFYALVHPNNLGSFLDEFCDDAFDPSKFQSAFGDYLAIGFGPVWHSEFDAAFAEVLGERNP